MKVYKDAQALNNKIQNLKKQGFTIGFVPTMGALHMGHISLVNTAKKKCNIVVASIFVNPSQFNNSEDLEKYPRMEEQDIDLLTQSGCDYIYLPEVDNVYPKDYTTPLINLHPLDNVMEGKARPGHFKGVTEVVYRLFEIVKPDFAFFGRKDFQQVSIINKMVSELKLGVKIVACPTIREENGLAMSSRNLRLSEEGKIIASNIFQVLKLGSQLSTEKQPKEVKEEMLKVFNHDQMKLEYLEIVNPINLEDITLKNEWVEGATACIVAHLEGVRLIDNLEIKRM